MNISKNEALSKAMGICSSQEKCKHDIRIKLKLWEVSERDIEEILDQLGKDKFIDEKRYATSYANDKFKFNNWGKIKIRYSLKQKYIAESIIDKALNVIDNKSYKELLTTLIESKNRSIKSSNQYDKKAKLIRFAQGRGFEYELINEVIDKLNKD